MKVAGSLFPGAQVARQVGRDVLYCLAFRTISYDEFVQELERMVDLAGYLGLGVGRHNNPLSALQVQFSAHLLNAVGVCTERVKEKPVRADGNGKFPWEPNAAEVVPAVVADDSYFSFSSTLSFILQLNITFVFPVFILKSFASNPDCHFAILSRILFLTFCHQDQVICIQ